MTEPDPYLSTVRMTVEPPDEQAGAIIEVAITARRHPAYLINAAAVAADAAARATMDDHPFHRAATTLACGITTEHPGHGTCVGLAAEDIAPRVYMGDGTAIHIEAEGLPDAGVLVIPGHEPPSPPISASGCAYGCP